MDQGTHSEEGYDGQPCSVCLLPLKWVQILAQPFRSFRIRESLSSAHAPPIPDTLVFFLSFSTLEPFMWNLNCLEHQRMSEGKAFPLTFHSAGSFSFLRSARKHHPIGEKSPITLSKLALPSCYQTQHLVFVFMASITICKHRYPMVHDVFLF